MKKICALIAVTCVAISGNALAQNVGSMYGEVAYSSVKLKDVSSDNLGTFKPTAARLTFGTVVTNNVAVEGYLLQGLSSDSNTVANNVNVDIKLNSSYGVAIRPFVNINESLEAYARLGTLRVKGEATASRGAISASEDISTSHTLYGVGAAYKLNNSWKAIVDYTKLSTKNETKSSSVSIGLRYNF